MQFVGFIFIRFFIPYSKTCQHNIIFLLIIKKLKKTVKELSKTPKLYELMYSSSP